VRVVNRQSSERGAVAVLVALLILPLTLLVAFAVDTGNWWTHKRHLQTQADAGTFAGAQGPWFPTCNEAAIEQKAGDYSGTTYNQQYTPSGTVHVLLNSTNYFENGGSNFSDTGSPCQTLAQATATRPGFLDVKATETNLSNFFGSIPGFSSVTAHTHARVEIQGALQENDVRPIAVRDDSQYQCARAQLWTTNSDGSLNSLMATFNSYTRTTLSDTSTQFQITGSATMPTKSDAAASNAPHVAVRILLGNTNCAATDTYADPSGGVNFINVYRSTLTVSGGNAPKLGSVSMPPTLSSCTPDPYFTTSGCNAVVKAYVKFSGSPTTSGANKNAFVTINGVDATAANDAGGLYWTASVPIGYQTGPHNITISWEQQYGTIGSPPNNTCKKGGNPAKCKGNFDVAQQSFSATDDDEDLINSGAISLVQIADGNGLFANSLIEGTSHNFTITVRIKGLQNSLPTDPPIVLRNSTQSSKRTGLVDCGQGNGASADQDAIVNGCPLGVYIWPQGSACVTPPSDPIDCVFAIPGNRRQKIASAIKDRINGGCNYWNAYRQSGSFDINNYIKTDDPRTVTMIITSPADLSGNTSVSPIPVIALATFYITGYDGASGNGTGCQNEPFPGSGSDNFQVWGHWIKFVPVGGGVGNGQGCDPAKFGDCIAVLTQ
jgi:Flp pilus assembly protein TadG